MTDILCRDSAKPPRVVHNIFNSPQSLNQFLSPKNHVLKSPKTQISSPMVSMGFGVLSTFETCTTMNDFIQERLRQRYYFLRLRCNIFDEARRQIERLMEGYRHMWKHKISERDLIVRRSKLSSEVPSLICCVICLSSEQQIIRYLWIGGGEFCTQWPPDWDMRGKRVAPIRNTHYR